MSASPVFEVIPLGNGNFNSSLRFATSLLLLAGGRPILIDCPDPLFMICSQAAKKSGRSIDLASLDDIVLTHLHGDHANGLEGLGFWRKFNIEGGRRPRIHTSRQAAEGLWKRLEPAMGCALLPGETVEQRYRLEDYFELTAFEIGAAFRVGEVEFVTRRTLHPIPCFGFRATYGGRRFGYSCDTAFDPGHLEFLSGCDLIFHETGEGIHTPLAELEALPEALRRKMHLLHLPDDFPGTRRLGTTEVGRVYTV